MRFNTLHLLAHGPFTDTTIDLSGGEQGLHLIYGPNEAGKTSALRAITDLLFDFENSTPDRFIHDYPKLHIGAQLQHSDGSLLEIVRLKRRVKSLRDGCDLEPLDDDVLARYLGDLDRELFHLMFGIDHARLRKGGEEVVNGGGRIGELLFAASAGLSELQAVKKKLLAESDALFKSTGRSGAIVQEISHYGQQRQQTKEAQVSVETWQRCDTALQEAEARKAQLDQQILEKRTEWSRLTRIRSATAALARWRQAVTDLAELDSVPVLPPEFADASQRAIAELQTCELREANCAANLQELAEKLAQLKVPTPILAVAESIDALRECISGYRRSLAEQPRLRTQLELTHDEIAGRLRRLGIPGTHDSIESLRLPAAEFARIRELATERQVLAERLQAARNSSAQARQEIAEHNGTIQQTTIPNDNLAALESALTEAQSRGDLESLLADHQQQLSALQADADLLLHQLPGWSGSLAAAEQLPVPPIASLDRFDHEFGQAAAAMTRARDKLADIDHELLQLRTQVEQLELGDQIPTLEMLDNSRQLRDQGWQLVQRAWRDGQPDQPAISKFKAQFKGADDLGQAYQQSVANADQMSDALRTDAQRVTSKLRLTAEIQKQERAREQVQQQLSQADAQLVQIDARWNQLWLSTGLAPRTPTEMRSWLQLHAELLQAAAPIRVKQAEINRVQAEIQTHRQRIAQRLEHASLPPPVDQTLRGLVHAAAAACEQSRLAQTRVAEARATIKRFQHTLAQAEQAQCTAEAEMERWQTDWERAMSRLGLPGHASNDQALSVLEDNEKLFELDQDAQRTRHQLSALEQESHDFETRVRDLVGRVAPDLSDHSVLDALGALTLRLQDALALSEQQQTLGRQQASEQAKLKSAQEQSQQIKLQLQEMCRVAHCTAPTRLLEIAHQSQQRQALESQVHELRQEIVGHSGGADFEQFITEVEHESRDLDSLQPRLDELERDIQPLNHQRDECLQEIERIKAEMDQMNGLSTAAELAADCEYTATKIAGQMQQLAVLRLATAVLNAGIERYRDQHQGPILERASSIFAHITQGAFQALRTEYGDQGEPIIVGIRAPSGAQVRVAEMSDGTCDQIYLALRIAFLQQWLRHHEPVPLIIDDVLLNFDDDRAAATLQVLAELSTQTQVIFFTHHSHLVEIARDHLHADQLFTTCLDDAPLRAGGPRQPPSQASNAVESVVPSK